MNGLTVARLPEPIRPKVAEGEWTLEQAAAVEEFAGDDEALARPVRTTGHGLHWATAPGGVRRPDRRRGTRGGPATGTPGSQRADPT